MPCLKPWVAWLALGWLGLGLGELEATAAPSEAGAFIPPRATVVLLGGLPGDVETEKAYRDLLDGWFEVLAQAAVAPARVFVLWDQPESLQPPPANGRVSRAGRDEFQALGTELVATNGPLVVIAWGHGGKQGETPVFHVRGPRLTPDDFRAFGARSAATESRWVLWFRGSGAFAEAVAGPKRWVLASERAGLFRSDPVGLPLVLKAVRRQPGLAMASLAEETGRVIAAWYEERSLLRTEEPTLWAGAEPPRLLAAEAAPKTVEAPLAEAPAPAPPATPPKTPERPGELSAAWRDIVRVDAAKYPEADGVVLRRRVQYVLGGAPALVADHEEFIQVLTAEGKALGDFDFPFAPPEQNLTFAACEVLRPDGGLLRLDPDEVQEAAEAPLGDYRRGQRKFFSLPGVGPGAVLHVRFQSEWKSYPLPHYSLEILLAGELPVVEAVVEITVPTNAAFHFAFEGTQGPEPSSKRTTYGATREWRLRDLPPQPREVLAPPGRGATLLVSTFPDWRAFGQWYARITKLTDTLTPELTARAQELTRQAGTERAKLRALCEYVTGLRYVAVPLGVNSLRPHAAAAVLKNQFGDCKDKANLLNTLLRAVGIPAHLVLVSRFAEAREDLPGLAFNHAISRVTLGGESLWIDTTDDLCRFGLLPPGDAGRLALVVDEKADQPTRLPSPASRDHQLTLRGSLTLPSDGGEAATVLKVTTLGYPDYALRAATRENKPLRATLPLLAAQWRPVAGVFRLEKQTFTSVSALDEDFVWQAEGGSVGVFAGRLTPTLVRAPFWLPKEWDLALAPRRGALFLHQGYPLTLEEEITLTLPADARRLTLPPVAASSAPPLRWTVEWSAAGQGTLTARLRAELTRGQLSLAETPAFQAQLAQLLTALATGPILEKP